MNSHAAIQTTGPRRGQCECFGLQVLLRKPVSGDSVTPIETGHPSGMY